MFNNIVSAIAAAALALTAAASGPAAARTAATAGERPGAARVLDSDAVPFLPPQGRADYQRFLQQATPRAFAVSPEGVWGWAAAVENDPQRTTERALENCRRWGGTGCRLYAQDLAVVWPGWEARPAAAPAQPLATGAGYSLLPDGRFLWHGPAAARGVYVWAHGRAPNGQDSRGSQPQPHVRPFNNAGYDVVRFDRDPVTDETDAGAAWLREALRTLRAQGYRRVVVGGQSRGAWNALQALDTPGLADAVIAIAPAAHGPTGSPAHAWALDDLRHVVAGAMNPNARVVVANFTDDPFDPDPEQRSAIFRALAGPRIGALLFLDRPRELTGHGAGADWRFNARFGACLLDFAEGRASRCG